MSKDYCSLFLNIRKCPTILCVFLAKELSDAWKEVSTTPYWQTLFRVFALRHELPPSMTNQIAKHVEMKDTKAPPMEQNSVPPRVRSSRPMPFGRPPIPESIPKAPKKETLEDPEDDDLALDPNGEEKCRNKTIHNHTKS